MPSILRNSRYRRDQRQLEEEEEMWFNEDDDYDDGPSVHKSPTTPPPFADEIFSKKIDSNLESIGGKTLLAFSFVGNFNLSVAGKVLEKKSSLMDVTGLGNMDCIAGKLGEKKSTAQQSNPIEVNGPSCKQVSAEKL